MQVLSDLGQGVLFAIQKAKVVLDDMALALVQLVEHMRDLLPEDVTRRDVGWRGCDLVLDEVAQGAIAIVTNRRLQADGLLARLQDIVDGIYADMHALRDLLGAGLASQFLKELRA